jgi:hypothetical protein
LTVVIHTFEDEAEVFGDKSDLSCLSPAKEIKGYLVHAVILGHVIYCLMLVFKGTREGLLGVAVATATLRAEVLETQILGMANSIIEVKLCSKVPLAIVCVLTTDIVGMEGEKCLIGRHLRYAAVKEVHRKVKLEERNPLGTDAGTWLTSRVGNTPCST